MGPRVVDMPEFVYHSTSPSEKEKKYDRQLRLWAAHGQQTLEDANLLLINTGSGTVGVEALKNLVLPGIGNFTIIDDLIVNTKDLGVNFFLDEDSLGNSRAECCVRLLEELNPDVKGESYSTLDVVSLERLFAQRQYTFILYTFPIEPQILATVKTYSRKAKIPSISIHSAGFYSYFQVYFPETFPIVDTHPDPTAATDLRLLAPWDELKNFADDLTEDLENMNAHEHGHVPYLLLLLYFLKKWKRTHGFFPSTYKEKTAFRDSVAAGARIDIPGGEENFDEAVSAVLKTVSVPTLSSSVREVFEYKPNEIESNASFWIIADAVKKFFKKHQQLPLPGSLPDMKAQSTVYVKLQNIYKTKARQDAAEVLETVREHPNGKDIEMAEVENFCKNAAFIKLIHASEEVPAKIKAISKQEFESDEMASMTKMPLSLFPIYLALRATSHVAFASSSDIIANIEKENLYAGQYQRVQQVAEEVARARGGELHNISALTGGMVAQEVIKIITKQYIPIDNTCIFDGVTSRTQGNFHEPWKSMVVEGVDGLLVSRSMSA